jgi:hypothetical protein
MIIKIQNVEVKPSNVYIGYGSDKLGNVYRLGSKRKLSAAIKEWRGYKRKVTRISIQGKAMTVNVHRIVASSWLGEPPSELHTDVNHINGDATDNRVENLEWATKSQNQRHAVNTGLKGKGDELYNSQLSNEQVHEICSKMLEGARVIDLAKYYNVSVDIMRKIKAGDTYFHIRQLYPIEHTYKFNYSDATIRWVCKKIKEGYSDKGIIEISRNPNLTIIEIKRVRYKIRYKYISDSYF